MSEYDDVAPTTEDAGDGENAELNDPFASAALSESEESVESGPTDFAFRRAPARRRRR